MKSPALRRRFRPGRRSILVTSTASALVATLGAWFALAGSASADPLPPGAIAHIDNTDPEIILVIADRPPRQVAPNAVVIDGMPFDLLDLQLHVDLDQGICPPGCDLTPLLVSQFLLNSGFLEAKTDLMFQDQGIDLDNIELGLPDDPMFANWVAQEGSNIAESSRPRTVDTSPTANSNYSVEARADGSGFGSYYARATVAGETSVSGAFNVYMDGQGAAGSWGAMSINSFIYLGENSAGLTVNGGINLFGGSEMSLQVGKSAVQVGMTGTTSDGKQVGMSASISADGSWKLSAGALLEAPGLPPLWVRGDVGGGVGASISAPDAGITIGGTTNGFKFDMKVDVFYDWFKKNTGSK